MFLFDLFRSLLPLHNPIGFGAADFLELAVALLLAGLMLVARSRAVELLRALANRPVWAMLALAVLPIAPRLLLLPQNPVPTPGVSDDFSYLLAADTLLHFRFANPPHPLHQFFETFFVLQEPSYASIFPLGQAFALALGKVLFGGWWAGVALSIGSFCALTYWMLRGWTTPLWALLGGLLAVIEFGPLNQWMNSFWGGALSAAAGCLVFGSLPRLAASPRIRDGILLGTGLALQALCRPFESVFLILSALVFLAPVIWRRAMAGAIPPLGIALGITLLHNHAVTQSWTTLPYSLSRYQYGVPATFTVQPNPVPHRELTREQQLDYDKQCAVHGSGTDTMVTYFVRWLERIRFFRFFLLPPLYIALPFFLPSLRELRFAWLAGTVLLFSFGTNFYPYFYPHYIAAVTCLLLLAAIEGLRRLWSLKPRAALLLLLLCAGHFLFWCGVHLTANSMSRYETWDAINSGDPEGRIAIARKLAGESGRQLVFVRYGPTHTFEEWVHNAADIDGSRVVWARDLGTQENAKLLSYYKDRTAWLLEPDSKPPLLSRYPMESLK